MRLLRRLLVAISSGVGLWVLVSVAGNVFDPARAALWSTSLMWAFLASLLVAPALVVIFDDSLQPTASSSHRPSAAATPADAPAASDASADERKPFVGRKSGAHMMTPDEARSSSRAEEAPEWVREQMSS
jgi:hypothetical protein